MKGFFTKRNIAIMVAVLAVLIIAATTIILLSRKEKKVEYTISFNSDGGSAVNSITALEGTVVKLPEDPTKEGYNFLHWENDEGKPVSEELVVEKNVLLVAIWVEKDKEICKVTFDTDGGTTITPVSVVKGEKLTLPDNPTKNGYEFKEWKDSNNNVINNDFTVEEDITLKASWTKKEKEPESEKPKEEPKNVEATEILLDTSDFSMVVNTSKTVKATVKPDNTTNKTVEWSSNNPSVVTVDNNGVVKAVGLGTAIIKAKTSNGKQAMISVTSEIKSITLSPDRTAISYNGAKEAKVTAIIDANGYSLPDSEIKWSIPDASGQNAPASSTANGKIATITARSSSIPGSIGVTARVGTKEAKTSIKVESPLTLSTYAGNTTNFSQNGANRYLVTFSGDKTLSLYASTDVTWEFTVSSPVITGISARTNRQLTLSVQYVSQNGLNIKARTAGGQMKEVVVTPTI